MAAEKLNLGTKDNKPPEAVAPPRQGDPLVRELVKSSDNPPRNEQAVIPDMVKEAPTPARKVIDLSSIQATADQNDKELTAPDVTSTPPETVPDQKRRGCPSKVDKAARDGAPHSVLDKMVCTPSSRQ